MKTPGRGRWLFLRVIRSSITIVLQFFPRAAVGGEVGLFAAEFAPLTISLERQNQAFPVVPQNRLNNRSPAARMVEFIRSAVEIHDLSPNSLPSASSF